MLETIELKHINDDRTDIYTDGRFLVSANFDDHGSMGMVDILMVVHALARLTETKIIETDFRA